MTRKNRFLSLLVAAICTIAFAGVTLAAKPESKPGHENKAAQKEKGEQKQAHQKKAHHQNGKQLLGEKVKSNGHHVIAQSGDITASVEVQNGKVAGLHAKHAKKGDLAVTKYKTNKKMAQVEQPPGPARMMTVQDTYVGTIYIGYSYFNDYGEEDIYWFPVDMILDGDTGAIEYVPSDSA
jgi:hypothetical protein